MRTTCDQYGTTLWLSANDTHNWAHRSGACWPCSTLAGHRLFASFAPNGDLVDMAIDGGRGNQDCPGDEFNAIVSDYLTERFSTEHPAVRE